MARLLLNEIERLAARLNRILRPANGTKETNMKIHRFATRMWPFSVALVLALAGCGSTPTRESTGELIDDSAITTKVKAGFFADKVVSALNISVETYKGTVQLSGFAKTMEEIRQAERIARDVKGVKAVRNDVVLR